MCNSLHNFRVSSVMIGNRLFFFVFFSIVTYYYMIKDLDRIVCVLLHKSADTNRFIREDSHATLIAMTQSMPPTKAIVAVLNEGLW